MSTCARRYNAQRGTFTSHDPFAGQAEEPQSFHAYAYVQNNPINAIDPTAWYRCSSNDNAGSPAYKRFCQTQFSALDFYTKQFTHGGNSLAGLLAMFDDRRQAVNFPGGSGAVARHHRQTNLSPAAERLEFIFWATNTTKNGDTSGNPTHFNAFSKQFLDNGFADNLRDSGAWPGSDYQIGHFLTAVDIGYGGTFQGGVGGVACLVGHELIGDSQKPGDTLHYALQCAAGEVAQGYLGDGFFEPPIKKIDMYRIARDYDARGDTMQRDCILRRIVELPDRTWTPEEQKKYLQAGRRGNSVQDLRLTVKGDRFGHMVAAGQIRDLATAQRWLAANLSP